MKPTLLVLAAGMGSRYGGLKQLDPMGPNDETVLDYSVYDAIRAGFGKVVFVIRREFEAAFKSAVGIKFENKIEVDYAFQELNDLPEGYTVPEGRQKPWGTAHAVRAALMTRGGGDSKGRSAPRARRRRRKIHTCAWLRESQPSPPTSKHLTVSCLSVRCCPLVSLLESTPRQIGKQ